MRKSLVVGNWKMHGSLQLCRGMVPRLAQAAREAVSLVVCPPAPYLPTVAALTRGSRLGCGAQNISPFERGAYTGEVAGAMLSDIGVQFAIVGHSERRAMFAETDEIVVAKARACLQTGLTPIVCVGETEQQRMAGETQRVIAQQVGALTDVLDPSALARCVLAYEPVWAIGTGNTASPDQAQEVHGLIRASLQAISSELGDEVSILYGGSVQAANAAELFAMPDIDGGLIGGASLIVHEFLAIYQSAQALVPA